MSNIWTGSFRSNNVPGVYGNLYTVLKPLTVWGYKTKVEVTFTGFAGIIQNIFSPEMQVEIVVKKDKTIHLNYNGVKIVFEFDHDINENTVIVNGHYIATKGEYKSTGQLYLQKGDDNYENNNCIIS